MFIFKATADGGLDPGSDYNRAWFKEWLKKHAGFRVRIELDEPESRDLRRYFEGVIVPKVLREFVNRVTDWMAEQGIPIPNHELYKQWRYSGFMAGARSYREWLQEQGIKSDGTPLQV